MANLISGHLGISGEELEKAGVFDAIIGIDTRLFLDPFLLKFTRIPEFRQSRQKIERYFGEVIKLLIASRSRGDVAWREALRRLTFRESKGISIGYGVLSSDGSAIGRGLAARLIETAKEVVEMGIHDPEIFELIGLFEEDFGADRLSDMTIVIIKDDIYKYTERIAQKFGVKNLLIVNHNGNEYLLPKHPDGDKPILFLPKELLRDLPLAFGWENIDHVVSVNQELRQRLNRLIGETWKQKIKKKELRDVIFSDKRNINELVSAYKGSSGHPYDFENDPASEVIWYRLGRKFAFDHPIILTPQRIKNVDELTEIVTKIINQFKKNIEVNGLSEALYIKDGFKYKPRHERFAQRIFYAVADSYCSANNVDINREPNAGSGPVDFKLSTGYNDRVLVEIKLSSNRALLKGLERQLPTYEKSEGASRSFYVVLRVSKSESGIKNLLKFRDKLLENNKSIPKIIVIDASIKPSASNR